MEHSALNNKQLTSKVSLEQHGKKGASRARKPNYNAIHADPLPITVTPASLLPPLSPLNIIYILFSYSLARWCSTKSPKDLRYSGILSLDSLSVNILDVASAQELWKKGFFGKGTLSRSEPTWLIRTHRKYGFIEYDDAITAEELTERRRVERREFKKERAKKEQVKIKKQLSEEGKLIGNSNDEIDFDGNEIIETGVNASSSNSKLNKIPSQTSDKASNLGPSHICEIEHLQLTLEEAFFLSYALGVLSIFDAATKTELTHSQLLQHCCAFSTVPRGYLTNHQVGNPFIISYVAYHHYRSLGWVIKSGTKFTVDFLLYNRGPAFAHAEFAVIVLPSYSHSYWTKSGQPSTAWDWMHCVNRVCSQVKKTVLLCYVEVPPPNDDDNQDVSTILQKYSVREVSVKRWLPSRNRD